MRKALSILILALGASAAYADLYTSADNLVESMKKYDLSADREGLVHLLSLEEPRQPEESAKVVFPKTIDEAKMLWKSDKHALAYLTSRPPTESTPAETGVLLLLGYSGTGWFIDSKIRFSATGKYADIQFEFTGGDHTPPPVVTVTTSNGGRGASYRASATYEVTAGRLIRKDP